MIDNIKLMIFDFDGVLTDNKVYCDLNGNELVQCNRADGLAFNALSKLGIKTIICSTEKNNVVKARGEKLNVETHNNIGNKFEWIKNCSKQMNIPPEQIFFIGNDINDFYAMKYCGYSACPFDSVEKIKKLSNFVLKKKGGEGVVREIVEDIFKIDLLKILYTPSLI